MKQRLRQLSEAEWTVMKAVWRRRETTVREVHGQVGEQQGWAYNTVKTFMERLTSKGYLKVRKPGKTYVYQAVVSRAAATRSVLRNLIEHVLDGATAPLVAYLAEQEELSEAEREQLRRLVESGAPQNGSKKGG